MIGTEYALTRVEDRAMNTKRAQEVLSILMGSDLYFEFSLTERLALVKRIIARMA